MWCVSLPFSEWGFGLRASVLSSPSRVHVRPLGNVPSVFSRASKLFLLETFVFLSVWASPIPGPEPDAAEVEMGLIPRAVSALSSTDISSIPPFTQFARAAYCSPAKMRTWTSNVTEGSVLVFVWYRSAQTAVVVSHQGTDPT